MQLDCASETLVELARSEYDSSGKRLSTEMMNERSEVIPGSRGEKLMMAVC
jgi:hypothetical protein